MVEIGRLHSSAESPFFASNRFVGFGFVFVSYVSSLDLTIVPYCMLFSFVVFEMRSSDLGPTTSCVPSSLTVAVRP